MFVDFYLVKLLKLQEFPSEQMKYGYKKATSYLSLKHKKTPTSREIGVFVILKFRCLRGQRNGILKRYRHLWG